MNFFYFSIFFLLSLNLFARTSIYRLDQSGGPFEKMAITNQGNMGLCYSYAMAQAASAELIKNKKMSVNDMTSPYLASVEASNLFWLRLFRLNSTIDGGRSCRTFRRSIARYGTCSTKHIEDQFYLTPYFYQKTNIDNIIALANAELTAIFQKYKSIPLVAIAEAQFFLKSVFPNSKEIDFTKLIITFDSRIANTFIAKFLGLQCPERHKMEEFKCQHDLIFAHSSLAYLRTIGKIDQALNNSSAPMISYCSSIMTAGPGTRGLEILRNVCAPHVSLIIGKRLDDNNNIQYLIRNSWGMSCLNVHKSWECDKGQFWIDAQELFLNSFSLEIMKKK